MVERSIPDELEAVKKPAPKPITHRGSTFYPILERILLEGKAGRWYIVMRYPRHNSAKNCYRRLNRGDGTTPEAQWEFTWGVENNEGVVYARFG